MSDWTEQGGRRRPHRLDRDEYRRRGAAVLFTVRVADSAYDLTRDDRPKLIAKALKHNMLAHGCSPVAWCVMPDHVHFIGVVVADGGDLVRAVNGFKRRASGQLRHNVGGSSVWQRSYWDRHARGQKDADEMVWYVLSNPVRKGLCRCPHDWPHAEYCGWPRL